MRRILATGANKGIGRAIVAAILEHDGETFAFLGSRDRGRGEAAKQALVAEHPDWDARISVVQLDVSSDESVAQAALDVKEQLGGASLYGLVNNAGIGLGGEDLATVLGVNVYGIHRMCEAFVPMLQEGGRVVNVTSAAGPMFVNKCSPEQQRFYMDEEIRWGALDEWMQEHITRDEVSGSSYGFSKACANSYTLYLARSHPELTVNACTPGYIETDLTRPHAASSGRSPAQMGMKPPEEGARSTIFLLFGEPEGSGHYYGSDGVRSPLHRYRSPGDPPYRGE